MNIPKAVAAAAVVLALAVPVRSQVKYGGYLGLEYVNGQAESAQPHGDFKNLLVGFLAGGKVKDFGFTIEVRAVDVESFDVNQAWAGYMPSETFTVKAGLFLVPFGGWNTASRPHETLLIRTPLNLENLYPPSWRDLGVLVEGRAGVVTYALYLGNGLAEGDTAAYGQQFRDNNTDKAKGGRIGLSDGRAFRAGLSYYTGKYDDQDMRDLTLQGADLQFMSGQWEIHGEYTKAYIENPVPFARGKSEGYSIWACLGIQTVQPVGSFQKLKVTDAFHSGDVTIDQSRWTAGLRYVLGSTLFIKGEYDWNLEKGTPLKNNQWQIQVGLSF
jgi:hypothetical protein